MRAFLRGRRLALKGAVPFLAALLAACGGGGGGEAPVDVTVGPAVKIEAYSCTAQTAQSLAKRTVAARPSGPRIQLAPFTPPKAAGASSARAPRQTGFGRPVPQTARAADLAALLAWETLPGGGRAAALTFVSPDALGIRLGLLVRRLPATAVVRAYGGGATGAVLEVTGSEILATLERNARAGDRSDAGRTYWLAKVTGEEVTLEIELPAGVGPGSVEFSIPQLSHVDAEALPNRASAKAIGSAGACELDVMCSDYQNEGRSVALMEFVSGAGTFLCTGTLVADSIASGTPYFLSANHCISRQTEASTLTTYWLFRSASCNSTQVDPAAATRTGGAALLYANGATDVSFMRLNAMPPAAALYAGSWTAPPQPGEVLAGIHHPHGDLQKFSVGAMQSFATCSAPEACSPGQANGNYLTVRWTNGTTEQGSSGSGLWATVAGKRYVVGHLVSGTASCSNLGGYDIYGRFDVDYHTGLKQWLTPPAGTPPVAGLLCTH